MLLNRKTRRANRVRTPRLGFRPTLEGFERRELMAVVAQPFLQGTVFVDSNADGVRATNEAGFSGATVSLDNQAGTVVLATTTTDAFGNYSFVNGNKYNNQVLTLTPGTTYKLVESTTNYTNTGTSALSQLDAIPATSANSIQVTVADPNKVLTQYNSPVLYPSQTAGSSNTGGFAALYYTLNGAADEITPVQLNVALSGTAGVNTAQFPTLCVGINDRLGGGTFSTLIDTQSNFSNGVGGEIAYLYNHYGTTIPNQASLPAGLSGLATKNLVAAVQLAIWELEYGSSLVVTGSNTNITTAADLSGINSAASAFIADATGKSEQVAVLDASLTGVLPTASASGNGQSVLATDSLNFGIKPTFPNDLISGVAYIDACGTGLSTSAAGINVPMAGSTAEKGVTINLLNSAGTAVVATTTTAADGSYSFGNVAPGTYMVMEATPSGLLQTGPATGNYTVTIGTNTPTSTSDNFANFAPVNTSTITSIVYTVDGKTVPDLSTVHAGSVVSVSFFNTSTTPVTLSLVGYSAPAATFSASTASQQQIVALQTGSYGYGKTTLTITVPNSYYQVDFVAGCPITTFGPAGSNVFYSPQGRLIASSNGGTQVYATDTLSGTVYADANGNMTFGAGDAPIGGVTVTLTGTTSAGVVLAPVTTTTASNGTYSFPGLAPGVYSVVATTPAGYIAEVGDVGSVTPTSTTVPVYSGTSGTGSVTAITLNSNAAATNYNFGEIGTVISGIAYVDATGVGLTTANVPPAGSGDTPEAGVTIDLYNASGGFVTSTVTAADGTYSFAGQPLGTYYVAEAVPAGQYQTGPNALYYGVTTTATSPTSTGNNFSNYMQCSTAGLGGITYTITTPAGVSTTVADLRGKTAQGDIVTANFTIAANAKPIMLSLVAYEAPTSSYSSSNAYQQVITSVATGTFGPGANGTSASYSLTVIEPNSYFQVDFVCGAPLTQLEANGSHVDYNFENRLISADNGGTQAYGLSSISGIAYIDGNGDSTYGNGDTLLAGVPIMLTGTTLGGQSVSMTTTSAANGSYSFTGLLPGIYSVTATTPPGYTPESGDVGSIAGPAYAGYLGTSGTGSVSWIGLNSNSSATWYNFGEQKATASISGTVYVDKNFDDDFNCSDTGLGGVKVLLETPSGCIVATTTSASNGAYTFTGVTPGVYQVVESRPSGYTVEYGNAGTSGGVAGVGSVTAITLASGANATGYDLGQVKSSSSCGYYCGSSGQWQIQSDCGWGWSSNLWSWLSKNCSSVCNSSNGWGGNSWNQNNYSVASFCNSLQNQYGSGSMQCQILNAALDQYFGKC